MWAYNCPETKIKGNIKVHQTQNVAFQYIYGN